MLLFLTRKIFAVSPKTLPVCKALATWLESLRAESRILFLVAAVSISFERALTRSI